MRICIHCGADIVKNADSDAWVHWDTFSRRCENSTLFAAISPEPDLMPTLGLARIAEIRRDLGQA